MLRREPRRQTTRARPDRRESEPPSPRSDEQQQMPIAFVGLEHIHVERIAQSLGHAEFEEFTVTILLDVHGVITRSPLRGRDADFEARTHTGEFGFNVIRIHRF